MNDLRVLNADSLYSFYIPHYILMNSGGCVLIIRLAELPITDSWNECMEKAVIAAYLKPLPDVLILPELFTIGFVLDSIQKNALEPEQLETVPLADAAADTGVWIVGGTFPVRTPRGIVNMLPVYDGRGKLVHTTEKTHLFRNMGEDSVFTAGEPAGVFDLKGVAAGASVCYDLRFPELFRKHVLAGAELLVLPAQWPQPRLELFRSLLKARSAEAQVFTAGCNLGGEHLGVRFHGGGGIATPSGKMIEPVQVEEYIRDFTLDIGEVKRTREKIDCLSDRRPDVYRGWQ